MPYKSVAGAQSELDRLITALFEARLLIESNYSTHYSMGKNKLRLTWQGSSALSGVEFATLREYIECIRHRQYTFLLFDASFVQISYDLAHSDLVGHRLVFFPSPVPLSADDWLLYQEAGLGILDFLEDTLGADTYASHLTVRSPLRFDFDPAKASDDHPASHLHISIKDCRIPVYGPLSMGHFIRFIFRNFYPEQWTAHKFIREWPCKKHTNTITGRQQLRFHVGCNELLT